MTEVLIFLAGAVVGAAVTYFVARNNQKKFNKALSLEPKTKAKEALAELKRRFKR